MWNAGIGKYPQTRIICVALVNLDDVYPLVIWKGFEFNKSLFCHRNDKFRIVFKKYVSAKNRINRTVHFIIQPYRFLVVVNYVFYPSRQCLMLTLNALWKYLRFCCSHYGKVFISAYVAYESRNVAETVPDILDKSNDNIQSLNEVVKNIGIASVSLGAIMLAKSALVKC